MAENIKNPNKLGQVTYRADLAKAMKADANEVFFDVLEKTKPQWQDLVTIVKSESKEEYYDTIGNLKPAEIKAEGDPIKYGTVKDGPRTTIVNETISNGFAITWEAVQDEKWDAVTKVKGSELARTMNAHKEKACAKVWDDVLTEVGADGVAAASHEHKLINSSTAKNDNLVEGEFGYENYQKALDLFNDWKNHWGEKFDTTPDTLIAHRNRQTQITQMFQSANVAFEHSNTKNTIPTLNCIFNTYINKDMVHILDTTIKSAVLQERSPLQTSMEWDNTGTLDFYYAAFERYKVGRINPGFGFVTVTGKAQ